MLNTRTVAESPWNSKLPGAILHITNIERAAFNACMLQCLDATVLQRPNFTVHGRPHTPRERAVVVFLPS